MRRAPTRTLIIVLVAAAAFPGPSAAQSFIPQAQKYLLITDAHDGRALWVQPAGLAARREASVSGFFTADSRAGGMEPAQYGLTLASRGVGLGWQHDELPGGQSNDAWSAGIAFGQERVSIGLDRRWYRGITNDGSWDFGGRYRPTPAMELSLAWRDVGEPVVAGDTIRTTLVPGATFMLLAGRLRAGADWEIVTDGWGTSAVRFGATLALPARLALQVRSEFSQGFDRRDLSIAVTWNTAAARFTGFTQQVRAGDDAYGAWLSAVRDLTVPRTRRPLR